MATLPASHTRKAPMLVLLLPAPAKRRHLRHRLLAVLDKANIRTVNPSPLATLDRQSLEFVKRLEHPCKRCINQGRYCHQHKTQDPSRSDYQPPPPPPEYPRESIFGRNVNGQPCKRCMKQGGFCYQHTYQQEYGAKQYSKKRFASANSSSGSRRVYGVRADGAPCKNCIKQGRFCFQHVHQEK